MTKGILSRFAGCNCHNHSDRCHFDPMRYNQTGFVSGGVCDDCRHNTEGYNCEQCQTGFYQVPGFDLRDPNICRGQSRSAAHPASLPNF